MGNGSTERACGVGRRSSVNGALLPSPELGEGRVDRGVLGGVEAGEAWVC